MADGRRLFITGGTRGIGRAILDELLPELSYVCVLAQGKRHLDALEQHLAKVAPGVQVQTIACDLSTPRKAVVLVEAELRLPAEGLDILVLDAGIFRDGTLADIDLDDYYENMEVNLNSSVVLTQLLLPHLRRGVNARIVIVGSTAAYEAYPLVPTYGIAKWGLRSFALNLRHELMPEDIGVTFISPGGTLTDMWAGEDLPPRRLLEPRDIGVLVRACLNLSSQAVVEELIVRPMLGDIHE